MHQNESIGESTHAYCEQFGCGKPKFGLVLRLPYACVLDIEDVGTILKWAALSPYNHANECYVLEVI